MSVVTYSMEFRGDGTFEAVPSTPVLVPGTTVRIAIRALSGDAGACAPIDLTGATVIAALVRAETGAIAVYQTDAPGVVVTHATDGRFALSLPASVTALLTPGTTYSLEIKLELANGDRRQVCYLPLTIGKSALGSE